MERYVFTTTCNLRYNHKILRTTLGKFRYCAGKSLKLDEFILQKKTKIITSENFVWSETPKFTLPLNQESSPSPFPWQRLANRDRLQLRKK